MIIIQCYCQFFVTCKVVILWNDLSTMPNLEELQIPSDYPVPIQIVRTTHNSINNRFLPYDILTTEAILQIDDDTRIEEVEQFVLGFKYDEIHLISHPHLM